MLVAQLLVFFILVSSSSLLPRNEILLREDSKPEFSGIWNARLLSPSDAPVQSLKISYRDPKLKISRILTYPQGANVVGYRTSAKTEFVYYTDGRGERQNVPFQNVSDSSTKSKTERIGTKFVTTSSVTSKQLGRKVATDTTVTLEVSPDGKRLKEITTVSAEGTTKRIIFLYDRVHGTLTSDINGEWVLKVGTTHVSLIVKHVDPEIQITKRVIL